MFGLDLSTLLIILGISAVLYLILAVYKKYAYYWWGVGGITICLPIAMVIPSIQEMFNEQNFSPISIFIATYSILYLALWVFLKKETESESVRAKREKIETIIFDGFFALKEKNVNEAYYIFKKGYIIDPDNPVIKTLLTTFHQGKHGLVKKNHFFEWRYKLLLKIKRKKT